MCLDENSPLVTYLKERHNARSLRANPPAYTIKIERKEDEDDYTVLIEQKGVYIYLRTEIIDFFEHLGNQLSEECIKCLLEVLNGHNSLNRPTTLYYVEEGKLYLKIHFQCDEPEKTKDNFLQAYNNVKQFLDKDLRAIFQRILDECEMCFPDRPLNKITKKEKVYG